MPNPAEIAKLFSEDMEWEIAGDTGVLPWIGQKSGRAAVTDFVNHSRAMIRRCESAEAFLFRPECLRLAPYYRPCGQSGDDPERQIYQQQVEREHWPAVLKPEIPRAAHRQEDHKQRQHRSEEV